MRKKTQGTTRSKQTAGANAAVYQQTPQNYKNTQQLIFVRRLYDQPKSLTLSPGALHRQHPTGWHEHFAISEKKLETSEYVNSHGIGSQINPDACTMVCDAAETCAHKAIQQLPLQIARATFHGNRWADQA